MFQFASQADRASADAKIIASSGLSFFFFFWQMGRKWPWYHLCMWVYRKSTGGLVAGKHVGLHTSRLGVMAHCCRF